METLILGSCRSIAPRPHSVMPTLLEFIREPARRCIAQSIRQLPRPSSAAYCHSLPTTSLGSYKSVRAAAGTIRSRVAHRFMQYFFGTEANLHKHGCENGQHGGHFGPGLGVFVVHQYAMAMQDFPLLSIVARGRLVW